MRCTAITKGGERCKLDATGGSYCWSHNPQFREQRRRQGARGGKARGSGSIAAVMRKIESVIDDILEGRLERGKGAVVFQGYNVLLKAYDTDRKLREVDELLERIERLEERASSAGAFSGAKVPGKGGRRNW